MERVLAFSTFLKLLELPEPQKVVALRGFLRGGGFNYWRPMQVLAAEVAKGELDLSGIQERVGQMAKSHQRKYNEIALTNLLKWTSRKKISLRTSPEKVVKKFGNSGLKVRIKPELAFSLDGRNYLMHIWATNNPSLSEETLSMGLYFFRHHLKDEHENFQFLIFDTVKNRIFAEFSIFGNAAESLRAQREILSEKWKEVNSITDDVKKPTHQEDQPGLHS